MSDNYGPNWCVTSEEVGGGIALILGLIVLMVCLMPAYVLGWHWAVRIWDVKVFKYPFATLIAGVYAFTLYEFYHIWAYLPLLIMFLVWLICDYFTSKRILQKMQVVQSVRKSTRWLFSA